MDSPSKWSCPGKWWSSPAREGTGNQKLTRLQGGAPTQDVGQQQLPQLARPQGSAFIREDRTMPEYRLYSINDMHTAMVRVPANATNGVSVVVDIWCVPADKLTTLLEQEPPGLSIGKVRLIR